MRAEELHRAQSWVSAHPQPRLSSTADVGKWLGPPWEPGCGMLAASWSGGNAERRSRARTHTLRSSPELQTPGDESQERMAWAEPHSAPRLTLLPPRLCPNIPRLTPSSGAVPAHKAQSLHVREKGPQERNQQWIKLNVQNTFQIPPLALEIGTSERQPVPAQAAAFFPVSVWAGLSSPSMCSGEKPHVKVPRYGNSRAVPAADAGLVSSLHTSNTRQEHRSERSLHGQEGSSEPLRQGGEASAELGAGRDSNMTQDDGGALKIRAQEFTGGSRRETLLLNKVRHR